MYDENTEILKTIRFAYPSLTKKELEVCRQVTIEMWQLWEIRSDIENGYM